MKSGMTLTWDLMGTNCLHDGCSSAGAIHTIIQTCFPMYAPHLVSERSVVQIEALDIWLLAEDLGQGICDLGGHRVVAQIKTEEAGA